MMLRPRKIWDIPTETKRITHKSLPKGNEYILLRDKIGVIYKDENFAELFSWRGQPAESPGLLSMVTIMQFAEHVQKIAGTKLPIEQKPLPTDDPKVRQPDITKAKAILGWEPQVPFEEGIMKTMEFFKKKLGV